MSGLEVGTTSTCNFDGLDQMFVPYYLPFTRKMLDMCRYCVALLFRWMWKRGTFHDFYNHITLIAVLVGPLTLMTCGLLVLFTLLNEVSKCTNNGSDGPSKHHGYWDYGYWIGVHCDSTKLKTGVEYRIT